MDSEEGLNSDSGGGSVLERLRTKLESLMSQILSVAASFLVQPQDESNFNEKSSKKTTSHIEFKCTCRIFWWV
jgi:hypothetical protein